MLYPDIYNTNKKMDTKSIFPNVFSYMVSKLVWQKLALFAHYYTC